MSCPGELWVAEISFTNGLATKLRPVLLLWEDGADVVISAVTSAPPRTVTDVELRDWKTSGLRVPSTIRLSRLDCLEKSLLRKCLGHLTAADAARLKLIWQAEIRPRF